MKQRVILSTYCLIATVMCICLNVFFIFYNQPPCLVQLLLIVLLVGMSAFGLLYMPVSISADEDGVYVNRILRIKAIPMSEVKSVRLCPPTMGTIRIFGSGGFLGYWGWFRERDLGKYFAYFGRSSDCFLVELKDGGKYMLGCRNPHKMVGYINSMINQ